ncbi:hypothetical protein L1D46_20795, partial [Pseudoalteromonas sp. Isolate3]|uniref:hypothetical protein n=1 Tax=Pseudoalteromonas sp. Isolate3 TaxID=2908526 RepID=UPI001EFD09D1
MSDKSEDELYINKIYTLRVFFYTSATILFYLLSRPGDVVSNILYFSIALSYFLQLINFGILFLKSKAKGELAFKSIVVSYSLVVLFSFILYLNGFIFYSIVTFQPLLFFAFYFTLRKWKSYKLLFISVRDVIDVFRKIWPLLLTSLFVILSTKLDVLVISNLLSYQDVAIYSVAVQITEPFSFVVTAFCTAIIYKIKSEDKYDVIITSIRIVTLYGVLVFLLIYFFGRVLIEYIYGTEYLASY